MPLHGILDVESVGLHGEGFAAALTIIDGNKNILESAYFGCPIDTALGREEDRTWVKEVIVPYLPESNYKNPREVRNSFWEYYMDWKAKAKNQDQAFTLWADCGFPVDTRFISDCMNEDISNRRWDGPYPLQEIATIRVALGLDPTPSYGLSESEQHNPIMETRYIATKLMEWLEVIRGKLAS